MKMLLLVATLMLMLGTSASAGDTAQAPPFMQKTFPEQALSSAFETFQDIMINPEAKLDIRTRELIALAVSAQVPCDYCVYYHRKAARTHGADDADIREALAVAALVRKWSTILNGSAYNINDWRQEVDAMFGGQ